MRANASRVAAVAVFFLAGAIWGEAQAKPSKGKAARQASAQHKNMTPEQVHQSALVIDTHADTTQFFVDDHYNLADSSGPDIHVDLDKAKRGNLGAEFFSVWVDPKYKTDFARRTLDLIDGVYRQVEKNPGRMQMAYSPADIRKAHQAGKLATLMGIEGGHSIENDLRVLRNFYRLGVRYMTITWSNTNEFADSSGDINDKTVKHHNGLTDFGKDVIYEMNRLGMMVDISHVSDKTFYDTLLISRAPVIASHSSARALSNHMRNMTDDMLRAVGRNGGVVMVNFNPPFVDEQFRLRSNEQSKEREPELDKVEQQYKDADMATNYRETHRAGQQWAAKLERAPFKSLIDQFDHIAKVAGIDHVGIGSDFDGISSLPEGIDSAADLPKITKALMERGYTAEQMHKILGGNLLRAFGEVERVSKELSAVKDERPKIENAVKPESKQ